jgi:transcription antitermination factor NusG
MRQWSDRKKKVEVPLFNSYVFVQLSESERNLVFQSVGAVRYLFWLGKPAIVRDEEIDVIKKWLNTSHCIDLTVSSHQIGDTIQLESGPFSAQKAKIQEMTNTHYVLVLESMGCVLKMKR